MFAIGRGSSPLAWELWVSFPLGGGVNAVILAVRCELSLPSIANYIREVSTKSAVRHMRSKSGTQLRDRRVTILGELKFHYECQINGVIMNTATHVYCDGSVKDDGKAGCDALVRHFSGNGGHAELCAIRYALTVREMFAFLVTVAGHYKHCRALSRYL
ncbi:hypothetical protein E2C01_061221 [Portunus trituberculatus]|uniref:Uncharacterized protein n=1 Tax=Portunus trituberculatus TaxID=210409 RepID=A0A5B7HCK8_PORTR|nr:hypothetical protein [Portunus trituberculatus]